MHALRIALLCRWYWEENRRTGTAAGGMAQQLAEAVAALGHEVVVLSQSPHVAGLEQARIGKLEVWLTPREKRRDFFTAIGDKLAKQLYRHRKVFSDALGLRDFFARKGFFNVLWAQSEEPDGLVAAVAAQRMPVPPILTQIHSLRYRFSAGFPIFTERPALGLAFRHASRIIANSELVAGCLSNYAGPGGAGASLQGKVRVVHPNLQHEFLRAATERGIAAEPRRILFFGALNEKKGALIFMDAIQKSQAAKSGAIFVVAGGLTEKNSRFISRWNESVAAARRLLGTNQLELLGKISSDQVIQQIRRASLIVIPSLFDEFSRALVESLILGRPVITTRCVGTWPMIETYKCGLVVEPNNFSALAAAIDEVSRPGAPYAGNAEEASRHLLPEFSPESIALQLTRHFHEIAH
ncbi:MAG TPA: glycosyltransferase family 4 protein [Candidatus Methylacidiphilales bacterium]|nr:glycosyltransferase family 4 protein [Candidatus Methylacidiphilales bacterium]